MLRSTAIYLLCFTDYIAIYPAESAVADANSKDMAILELLKAMNTIENMETSLESMKDTIKMISRYFIKEIEVILDHDPEQQEVQLVM